MRARINRTSDLQALADHLVLFKQRNPAHSHRKPLDDRRCSKTAARHLRYTSQPVISRCAFCRVAASIILLEGTLGIPENGGRPFVCAAEGIQRADEGSKGILNEKTEPD